MPTSSHGFTLLREVECSEVSGIARLWRHNSTGAELLSVVNKDENKCFSVALRTPPKDSTGVAHILEHSVLCGSAKYPVKEPFVELLKGSLQTFLNAFTFPDKTCYPVASANLQDFYNLIDVYIDAVFHPRISQDIFHQEGWHVDAESADGPWAYKGVVYNEMKGAYSTPDSVLAEQSQQSLFPDMLYGLDSGGEPEAILGLTYEAFKDFHSAYYHPANARFFFWGDDPEDQRLAILEQALAAYDANPALAAQSVIPLQPRRDTPRHIECAYASSPEEDRAMFTVNWLLCESADVETSLTLEILEHILEGLPGSPLRKALIDSGFGEDTTGVGLESDLRQMYYSVGLKGLAPADVSQAEMLIFETLAALAEDGIAKDDIEAAMNSVEFSLRENNSGRFPRGLSAMIQSLSTWLYDGDPFASLAWEAPLAHLKSRLAAGEAVFEQALKEWFLNNEHRSTLVLLPDAQLAAQREAAEKKRLARIQQACSPQERQELVDECTRLHEAQAAPDSPEALATIPGLGLEDLPLTNSPLPLSVQGDPDSPFLFHDIDTTGIVYANLLLPLDHVPASLIPLVPLLARALTDLGTTRSDFVELGTRIAAKTGGIWAMPFFTTACGNQKPLAYLAISGKAVSSKVDDLFELFHEILLQPALDNQERIGQILLENKARFEHGLVAAGHGAVSSRLRAHFTVTGWLEEATSGISALHTVRAQLAQLEQDWPTLLDQLRQLYTCIVRRPGSIWDVTCDAKACVRVDSLAAQLKAALPDIPASTSPIAPDWACPVLPLHEAFIAPAQVNFVGKGANLYASGYSYHGSANVIFKHLRMGYLWERVRVQGGAYGAFCSLDRMSGTLVQASYRDPAVLRTLQVYDGTADYLRAFKPDSRELTSAIVGAIGDLDTYLLPDAKGSASLTRYLTGDSEARRQQMREEILSTTPKDFHNFAECMAEAARNGVVCVLGGATAQTTAEEQGWKMEKLL